MTTAYLVAGVAGADVDLTTGLTLERLAQTALDGVAVVGVGTMIGGSAWTLP